MGLTNLRDLVEATAHKWYKDNEKDSIKAKWGRTYNWKELVKEIDWRSLKFVIDALLCRFTSNSFYAGCDMIL
jgi:hypothetical protein